MKNKYNIKELGEKLNICRKMKLEDVKPDDVDEINSIKINRRKSSNEILIKAKNPYTFKVNGKLVKIEFLANGKRAKDTIIDVIKDLYG